MEVVGAKILLSFTLKSEFGKTQRFTVTYSQHWLCSKGWESPSKLAQQTIYGWRKFYWTSKDWATFQRP